eukprot:291419_1
MASYAHFLLILSCIFITTTSVTPVPTPFSCNNYYSCYDCVTADTLFHGCSWCPSTNICYDNSKQTCTPTQFSGQAAINIGDCDCLTATSCEEMVDKDLFDAYRGWCPYYNKCYQGNGSPWSPLSCPADQYKGQFAVSASDCKCLSATSCQYMTENDLYDSYHGWCPAFQKCYRGNGRPFTSSGLWCPQSAETGQWVQSKSACECLTALSCQEMDGKNLFDLYYGWCPYHNKCFAGNGSPFDNIQCPASDRGSWVRSGNNCAQTCSAKCIKCYSGKCQQCMQGYNGNNCQFNNKWCNVCKNAIGTFMGLVLEKLGKQSGSVSCVATVPYTYRSCLIVFSETAWADPFICAAVTASAYKLCDKIATEIPTDVANLTCETGGLCEPQLTLDLRRRIVSEDIPQYPIWPSTFWMSGIQTITNDGRQMNYTNFTMGYSYMNNLVYSKLLNEQINVETHYILNNNTKYFFHFADRKCNFSVEYDAPKLTETNYLNQYLRNIGILQLTFNGTLASNNSISQWYSNICKNNYTDEIGTDCEMQFYYFDMPIYDENNKTLYRIPLYTQIIVNTTEIKTEFHTFIDKIQDVSVFYNLPTQFCVSTTTTPTSTTTGILSTTMDRDKMLTTKNKLHSNQDSTNKFNVVVITLVIVTVCMVMSFISYMYCKRKQTNQASTFNNDVELNYQLLDGDETL